MKGAKICGLMVDCARLMERHAFYFDLLPFMGRWGFNTLWWHFSDDQGFALELDGHPELATPHAFSKKEMARLIAEASRRGIDVVPEVESLGHARYITRLPQYAHLGDGDPALLNAICPSHPETLPLLGEIIAEVADLFPGPYFHAGLDEVNLAGCRRCAKRKDAYARHVRAVREIVVGCGKRMIMWADHVENEPRLLGVLPKDIVLAHWQYGVVDAERVRRSIAAGFDVICAPAICHWGNVIQPNAGNLTNLEATAAVVRGLEPRRTLGVVTTWWTPWRGLRGSYLFSAAYAAKAGRTSRGRFAREFARDHFGLEDADAADALLAMHDVGISFPELNAMLFDSQADLVELIALAATEDYARRAQLADRCAETLTAAAARVTRNQLDFEACRLAAQVASACFAQGRDMVEFHALCREAELLRDQGHPLHVIRPVARQAITQLLTAQRRLDRLARAVGADWDRTRYPDDPRRGSSDRDTTPCEPDMLLGRLLRCGDYLRRAIADRQRRLETGNRVELFP